MPCLAKKESLAIKNTEHQWVVIRLMAPVIISTAFRIFASQLHCDCAARSWWRYLRPNARRDVG